MNVIESRMTEIKREYESVMKQLESTSSELTRLKLRKAYLEGAFNELDELNAKIEIEGSDDDADYLPTGKPVIDEGEATRSCNQTA